MSHPTPKQFNFATRASIPVKQMPKQTNKAVKNSTKNLKFML